MVETLEQQHELYLKHELEVERNSKINGKTLSIRKRQREKLGL